MIEVHEALRRWATGLYPLEAGAELLIRAFDGRFATPANVGSSKATTPAGGGSTPSR